MEDLSTALFYDTVPDTWVARAYPSMMGLAAWYADLLLRIRVSTAPLRLGDQSAQGSVCPNARASESTAGWPWSPLLGGRVQPVLLHSSRELLGELPCISSRVIRQELFWGSQITLECFAIPS